MKQLIEDATTENARIFTSSWRSANSSDEDLETLAQAAEKLIKSPDIRDLVILSVKDEIIGILSNPSANKIDTAMNAAIMNTTAGIMIGLKYAMYLHEQRELAHMESVLGHDEKGPF